MRCSQKSPLLNACSFAAPFSAAGAGRCIRGKKQGNDRVTLCWRWWTRPCLFGACTLVALPATRKWEDAFLHSSDSFPASGIVADKPPACVPPYWRTTWWLELWLALFRVETDSLKRQMLQGVQCNHGVVYEMLKDYEVCEGMENVFMALAETLILYNNTRRGESYISRRSQRSNIAVPADRSWNICVGKHVTIGL